MTQFAVSPGEKWYQGKLEFMLSQRGKPLLVHDGYTFGIQYIRKDKKYWQCNLSRKFNCKARVTTTEQGEIIVTNNEHCHTEIRQHLRKDYKLNRLNNSLNHLHQSLQQQQLSQAVQMNLASSTNSDHNPNPSGCSNNSNNNNNNTPPSVMMNNPIHYKEFLEANEGKLRTDMQWKDELLRNVLKRD